MSGWSARGATIRARTVDDPAGGGRTVPHRAVLRAPRDASAVLRRSNLPFPVHKPVRRPEMSRD
jgi:hypothetical protein